MKQGIVSLPDEALILLPSLLSGGQTPLESMPVVLQKVMQFVPSTHFVAFSQAVLFRDATPAMVWPMLLKMFAIGLAYTVFTVQSAVQMWRGKGEE